MRFSEKMGQEAQDPAIRMFAQRSLDIEVAARMGASYQPERGIFQFQYPGFVKNRSLKKEFWLEPKGEKLQFWNIESLRELSAPVEEPLVICEGEFDAIAVMQCCGGFVISVPNGVAGRRSEGDIIISQDNRFAYLWENDELIREIAQFKKIILCTDNDDPGKVLRDELALRIGESQCWYVEYPEGFKDPNDLLAGYGQDHADGVRAVQALIDGAKPLRPGHLVRPLDIPKRSLSTPVTTGWSWMDGLMKIERPELLVVTGIPNHGKGQFIRCLAFNLAETHGWRTAFLTPEDPPHRLRRDMERFAKRRYFDGWMAGEVAWKISDEQACDAENWFNDHFRLSLPPEDEPITLDLVEREMEAAALIHNCQVFVIDPWNEVEHDMRSDTETQYIEKSLRRLLRKMRRLNLLLVIAAHPKKLNGNAKPELYDINGSSHWKNKCHHGLIIYKPDENSTSAEITLEKSKDWETMGKPGTISADFQRGRCDYMHVSGK